MSLRAREKKMKKRIMRQEEIIQAFKDHGGTVTFDKDVGCCGMYVCTIGGTKSYWHDWIYGNDGKVGNSVDCIQFMHKGVETTVCELCELDDALNNSSRPKKMSEILAKK